LSSISLELTRVQDFSLRMLYEQEVGEYPLPTARPDRTYLSLEKLKNMLYISISPFEK